MANQNIKDLINNRSKYLRISSKDRTDSSNSTTDFNIIIPDVIDAIQNCKGFILSHVGISHMFKNVPEAVNFTLYYDPDGALPSFAVTVTIPAGQYNITTLLSTLEGLLNTELQLSDPNLAITLSLNADNRVVFTDSGTVFGAVNIPLQINSSVDELLGISSIDDAKAFASEITLTNAPYLYGPKDVLITSNVLSDYTGTIESDGKYLSTIAHVPLIVEYGYYQVYKTDQIELEGIAYANKKNINQFDIQVRNDLGEILDLQGHNWEITIKLYY